MIKKYKIENNSRGAAAILITMLILTFMIIISLVVAQLMIQEVRISRDIIKSFKAYEAAVAGLESGSWEVKQTTFPNSGISDTITDGGNYDVSCEVIRPSVLISVGKYLDVERQIEVNTGTNFCP